MVPRACRGPALVAPTLLAIALLVVARPAQAWVDVHVEGDDVRVSVEPSGKARVEHRLTLKIAGGPLRAFDVRGVEGDAAPEPEGYVAPLKEASRGSLASATPVTMETVPANNTAGPDGAPSLPALRVRFQNDRGLGRGVYLLVLRYRTDLSDRIRLDGAMAKVSWRGPVWEDGLASARVTFALPAAPSEPRPEEAAPDGVDPTSAGHEARPLVLSTVRRGTTEDTIELLRPYAPRDEAVTWTVRTDIRAFKATSPEVTRLPPPPEVAGALAEPRRRAGALAVGASLFLLYALLVARKSLEVARDAAKAGVAARPFVPLPTAIRATLAGLVLAAGVGVELLLDRATLGAALVLAAAAFAAHRTPRWDSAARLRGPGRWLPVTETEALAAPPQEKGGLLDASTWAGKGLLLVGLAALGGIVAVLDTSSPYQAHLVAFDATALLVLFATGRRAELPQPPQAAAGVLRRVVRRVRREMKGALPGEDLRVVGRIRVPEGSADPDELRLGLSPRRALAGFVALEVGVVFARGAGSVVALPEVLLRFTAGSACEEAALALNTGGRRTGGRKASEQVLSFSPKLPTARMTAGLVVSLLQAVMATGEEAARKKAERQQRAA
jgi:hypothetical protein